MELCVLGRSVFGEFASAPCPALRFTDGVSSCGLVEDPGAYVEFQGLPSRISAAAKLVIGVGFGCDTQGEDEDYSPEAQMALDRHFRRHRAVLSQAASVWGIDMVERPRRSDTATRAKRPRRTKTGATSMTNKSPTDTPAWQTDIISVPPTIETDQARIWQIDLAKFPVASKLAGVALWLIEAPWAHPFWHSYSLSLVSMRPGDYLPAPVTYIDGATHEMVLMALDPAVARQPIFDAMSFAPLIPANFAAQMIATDEEATAKAAAAVAMIAKGELSPDSDFLHQWVELFGDSMLLNRATKH